ncbi:MAG: MFS transporter [Chloroflexi bacterium]|nr:MAG: MFS transporter [Chloroflexota bacterium]
MSLREDAHDQPARFEPNVREVMRSRALLRDPRFASLWLSHGLALTAQNALLFTLLVVVFKITGNSLTTSILVLCFILPSIPMGFIVGVVLDRTRKETVLVLTSLVRALGCILFLLFHGEVWTIYLITIGHATAGLFFNPAVISLIPTLVSRDRLVPANSLYNFTLTAAQLVGIVFLAPAIIKTLGADGMFIIAALMFLSSAALASRLHTVQEEPTPRLPQGPIFGGLPTDFRESWQMLFSDRYSVLALVQLIISSTLVLLFSILIPRYMQDVIGVPPESAAFVFAPTGIGALVGLRFLPWFTKMGKNRVVVIGLAGIAVCLVLLALVEPLAQLTEQAPGTDWLARQLRFSLLQGLTMLIAGPMGFCYALLNAPAQTVLHERAPPEMRGRIFATQVVSANFISLLPLLVIGAATDLVKVPAVLIMIAAVVAGVAFLSAKVTEREEQEAPQRPPPRPPRDHQEVGARGGFTEAKPGPDSGTGKL